MIQPFGLQHFWLVRRLQRQGVPLAIEHVLTHPHEPLWTALTAPWPWAGVGVATFVLRDRMGGRPRSAFIQLIQRANRPEADILHIAPALAEPANSGGDSGQAMWAALLDHCARSAGSRGLQRIYVSVPAGSLEEDYMRSFGFCRYAHETIFRLSGNAEGGGPLVGFRPQRPQDSWALQRLYLRNTPRLVQQSEGGLGGAFVGAGHGATSVGPPFSWWEPDDWQGIVWEPAGEVRGAVQVHVGRAGHWLRIWGANELAGRELRALIGQGLGMINQPRSGKKRLLRGLVAPAARNTPIYIGVRDYELGLSAALTGFGFAPYTDRVRFVKHTVVAARAAVPAAAQVASGRELRREVPVPARRSSGQ